MALENYEPEVDSTNVVEAITFNRPAHNILLNGGKAGVHFIYVNLDEFATRDIVFFDVIPCYGNRKRFDIMTDKIKFKSFCQSVGLA